MTKNAGVVVLRLLLLGLALGALSSRAGGGIESLPPAFHVAEIASGDVTLHVRIGGQGPAVVMLHGFGDTGDMWAPLAAVLVRDHTVVIPDLRGMGLSTHPPGGYDKKTQAADIAHGRPTAFRRDQGRAGHGLYYRPWTERHELYRSRSSVAEA